MTPSFTAKSPNLSNSYEHTKATLDALIQESMARKALEDAFYWMTECTKTKDEQNQLDPYKPFPKKRYLLECLKVLLDPNEPTVYTYKSRTMMMSWCVSAAAAWTAFTHPATKVVIQSQDHDRALHDVQNCKILWENSIPRLRERWPLPKPLKDQPYERFRLSNGSEIVGIPGDPRKIKSEHPTIYIQDESAIIEQGEESLNEAIAARCLKIWCVSSAFPGWFADLFESSLPARWPDYPMSEIGKHCNLSELE